jgi:hypothetical protein
MAPDIADHQAHPPVDREGVVPVAAHRGIESRKVGGCELEAGALGQDRRQEGLLQDVGVRRLFGGLVAAVLLEEGSAQRMGAELGDQLQPANLRFPELLRRFPSKADATQCSALCRHQRHRRGCTKGSSHYLREHYRVFLRRLFGRVQQDGGAAPHGVAQRKVLGDVEFRPPVRPPGDEQWVDANAAHNPHVVLVRVQDRHIGEGGSGCGRCVVGEGHGHLVRRHGCR